MKYFLMISFILIIYICIVWESVDFTHHISNSIINIIISFVVFLQQCTLHTLLRNFVQRMISHRWCFCWNNPSHKQLYNTKVFTQLDFNVEIDFNFYLTCLIFNHNFLKIFVIICGEECKPIISVKTIAKIYPLNVESKWVIKHLVNIPTIHQKSTKQIWWLCFEFGAYRKTWTKSCQLNSEIW